ASPQEKGFIDRQLSLCTTQDAEAVAYLDRGIAADRAVHNLKGEVEKVTLLARRDIEHSRFGEARRRLEDLKLPATAPAIAKYLAGYYAGLLGERVGD